MEKTTHLTVTIPGYHFVELLHCSAKTLVYRAVPTAEVSGQATSTPNSVVIKLPQPEHTSFNDLLQIRNHYSITKNIQHLGIVASYDLEPYGNSYALIMEDFRGISLRQYAQMNRLTLNKILELALQLAGILEGLYQHRVIHKDIQPAHILINPTTQQVKLIDFSIASLLPKETQEIQNPNILEGTLEYLSPEQTGRMNRGIDYRSDYYSLGVTLYELLTQQLPCRCQEPMELVHCHLAQQPTPPHEINPDIPPPLSALILKLMAKNAEDRYQSAFGLKYDLEICLDQLQQTGTIEPFELGKRDICDRFLICEKLYGREAEVQTLLAAFERVSLGEVEMILVAGFSGIGKTAVINEVHKPIVRKHGYFIKGKFDQFQHCIPLSGFVQAFRDLMEQLLYESDVRLAHWQQKILAALGDNAQVIIEVIPELERIIGHQPAVPELSGNAAQNRFNLLFQKFIKVFTTKDHPLVIFIDDLQWADSDSLQLIHLLLQPNESTHLLLIGAYRDNEVSSTHPLKLTLYDLEKEGVVVNAITLAPLSKAHLNQLIADTLSCDTEMALPLTKLINQKTKGNPFFSIQFLKALYQENLITFNHQQGYWQCDITQIKAKAMTDDVVEFIAVRLQKLSETTQNVLKLAACIGNQFDLETLAIVLQQSLTEAGVSLWNALQEELIVPASEVYKFFQENTYDTLNLLTTDSANVFPIPHYKFLHDRVQQAAYSLIPETQKKSIHLKIGQRLLENTLAAGVEEKIFDIVNQLNYSSELITQPQEREKLVQLNLKAGRKAKATTAYGAALEYFKMGIHLLENQSWETDYSLTLALYEEAIEAAYLSGDFQQMERWKTILLSNATTLLDQVKTYEVQIAACVARNQLRDAIDVALSVLTQLGIDFPQQPTPTDWFIKIQEVIDHLAGKPVASALELPLMSDPIQQAALRILLSIDAPSYLCFPELLPLTICQEVNLSLTFGNLPDSAKAYANYGLLLCSGLGDLETGYQFGQLALNLLKKLESKEIYARTSFLVNFFIRHWKEPLHQTLKPLQEAYKIALETGDLIHAAIAAEKYCYHAYFAGKALPLLAQEMKIYADKMLHLKQDVALRTHEIHWQSVLNLMGESDNPCLLIGQACDETVLLPRHLQDNTRTALYYFYFNKLLLCYLFNDYSQAIVNAELAEQYLDGGNGQYILALFYFYDSLALLATYSSCLQSRQNRILEKVADNQEKLLHWVNHAPINFQHKYDLVEAERYRVLGQKNEAIESYDLAIKGARDNEYFQEAALANEVAARFYLNWGKEKIAQNYLIEAYDGYTRWGAKAKTESLEKRYPKLRTASTLAALDFAAICQASHTLSREIHLDKFLITLLNTVITNAGASKCVLMLLWEQSLQVEAVTEIGQEPKILQAISVDESTDIPISLIYTVKHSLQTVVIDEAGKEASLLADAYIIQQKPQSLLCTPILNQGKLIGILYLENRQMAGAFTRERVEVLNLLCSQAAISLENSRLYEQLKEYSHQLEIKVAERTADLEKANRELYRIATLDGLTLVANRRYFDSYLQKHWQRLLLSQQPLGLLLCDIDFFKRYNDYYGHQAGDECLKQVAQLLTQVAKRSNDLVARYGGEEFVIVLPDTHELGAQQVAENIGLETQRLQLPHAKSPIAPYITLSIGVTTIVPHPEVSWETLIATADRALYKAKKAGRNRYCIYSH
jgi:diguanylate cyclase (GGDEF)-like protein